MSRPVGGVDARVPVVLAPAKFCPRKLALSVLQPHPTAPNMKRYPSTGALGGYFAACPGCGFAEMHLQHKAAFVEDPTLSAIGNPPKCSACKRRITIEKEGDAVFLCAYL